jgi:hypothetical protein
MRRERLYLEDIIDSIEKIQSFTAEMDFNSFIRDDKTKSAVIREFEIIGAAAKIITTSKGTHVTHSYPPRNDFLIRRNDHARKRIYYGECSLKLVFTPFISIY